jgi:glycosyl transferase family 25
MRVVVVNMEKSKDRWNRISEELSQLNVKHERFPAIEGKKLSTEEINENTTFMARTFFCTHASIGCALSHISIWKNFTDSGEDFICVAEDDATFSDKFPKVLEDIPEIFRQTDFDIFELYSDVITDGEVTYVNNYYKIVKPKFGLATCCYVLSRKGATKLYELFEGKVSYTIDFHIA